MATIESAPNKPKWLGWMSKALLFIVSLLVFMEGGARIALSLNPLRRRITGFDDSSYRLQWVRLHRIHEEWTGAFSVYHPVRGWALRANIKDMHVVDGTILNSNSKGIRGKTEYEYQRTPGKQRIVVLGDSFTFGAEVAGAGQLRKGDTLQELHAAPGMEVDLPHGFKQPPAPGSRAEEAPESGHSVQRADSEFAPSERVCGTDGQRLG